MAAAKAGPWQYHSEVLTDQSPEEVCTNIIREKLLEYLPQEVPYSLTQVNHFTCHTCTQSLAHFKAHLFYSCIHTNLHEKNVTSQPGWA